MKFIVNDLWESEFTVSELGVYEYTIEALVDHLSTWWKDIQKKATGSDNLSVDLKSGISLLAKVIPKVVETEKKVALQRLIALLQKSENQSEILKLLEKELDSEFRQKYPLSNHLTRYPKELKVIVDRKRAGFSAWYEMFPRSTSSQPGKHGTFRDCLTWIPQIAHS